MKYTKVYLQTKFVSVARQKIWTGRKKKMLKTDYPVWKTERKKHERNLWDTVKPSNLHKLRKVRNDVGRNNGICLSNLMKNMKYSIHVMSPVNSK